MRDLFTPGTVLILGLFLLYIGAHIAFQYMATHPEHPPCQCESK